MAKRPLRYVAAIHECVDAAATLRPEVRVATVKRNAELRLSRRRVGSGLEPHAVIAARRVAMRQEAAMEHYVGTGCRAEGDRGLCSGRGGHQTVDRQVSVDSDRDCGAAA